MTEIDLESLYTPDIINDFLISRARLPTKFGSLKELHEGISKEVFHIIYVEIIMKTVVYDGNKIDANKMAEYFVNRMPKLKDSKDIDDAYESFKLLGKEHVQINLYIENIDESAWFYDYRFKSKLVDTLYKIAFGMIYGELYFNSNLADDEQFKK